MFIKNLCKKTSLKTFSLSIANINFQLFIAQLKIKRLFMKMFVISVLNDSWLLLVTMNFYYNNHHFVEVSNTHFNSNSLLNTLLSISKKQIYAFMIVRIFESCRTTIKSFERVDIVKTIQIVFTNL